MLHAAARSVQSYALIYKDDALLVLDKPSGLLAVPGRGAEKQDCLSARVQADFPGALIVHRLDQATSGLIVMALDARAQRDLGKAFADRLVHKRYAAVVHGSPAADEGAIDLPILADWDRRPLRIIDPAGQPSLTRWRVLERLPGTARLELEPVTGRSHQLRVHLQATGHPILGDTLYAPPDVQALAPRLLLHAEGLELPHPSTGRRLRFESAAPF
jgi:tRNA pseudouridine32 synthase / 23S rRNA pseudouridine746 synthase